MKTISPELNQTLTNLAETLVTPERYGHVAVASAIPVENLGGLFDDPLPLYFGD